MYYTLPDRDQHIVHLSHSLIPHPIVIATRWLPTTLLHHTVHIAGQDHPGKVGSSACSRVGRLDSWCCFTKPPPPSSVFISRHHLTERLVLLVSVFTLKARLCDPNPTATSVRPSVRPSWASTLQPQQAVSVLELPAVLVLQHVQGHLAALLHHALAVAAVTLQQLQALVAADGAQRLGRLVPHHGALAGALQGGAQGGHGRRVLHLAQHIANLVAEECAGALQACQAQRDQR